MKFGNFKIGKSNKKNVPKEETDEEALDVVLQDTGEDDTPARANAPIQELSLDEVNEEGGPDVIPAEETFETGEDETDSIKLVEVQADATIPETPPAAAPASVVENKDEEKLDINASISKIFNNIEDEENPLANLVKALPDVAASELIDDLKEINDIIRDWQKK